jgi:hypothetical protein
MHQLTIYIDLADAVRTESVAIVCIYVRAISKCYSGTHGRFTLHVLTSRSILATERIAGIHFYLSSHRKLHEYAGWFYRIDVCEQRVC